MTNLRKAVRGNLFNLFFRIIFYCFCFNFRWDDLKNRVVEHNIRIMAKYYTKVTLKRMSELLDLKVEETEDFLSKMVRWLISMYLFSIYVFKDYLTSLFL